MTGKGKGKFVYLVFRQEDGHQAFETVHKTLDEALKQAKSRSLDWMETMWTVTEVNYGANDAKVYRRWYVALGHSKEVKQ